MLLKANGNNTESLSEDDFKNEKELQTFFEKNIELILGFKFVDTEFTVGNFRIDTVAFDEEANSFQIIEYKNVKNHSLVDQGYTYLKILLERKADFVLRYNEIFNKNSKISDIDFTASRVIFVSPIFTSYQINATDFKNIPIDLLKITRYEDNLYLVDKIKKESNQKVEELNSNINETVNKEIKVYTEDDHLKKCNDIVRDAYYELKSRMLNFDDVDVDVKKMYIAFKGKKNIIDVSCLKNQLKVAINMKKGTLKGSLDMLEDVTEKGHWGNGDYICYIKNIDDVDNFIPFIKQSLEVNKK